MKILIVDDFSTMRRIVKNLLRDLGFTNTSEADDGLTALGELLIIIKKPQVHACGFVFESFAKSAD